MQNAKDLELSVKQFKGKNPFLFAGMHQERLKLPKINVNCTVAAAAWMARMLSALLWLLLGSCFTFSNFPLYPDESERELAATGRLM